MDKDFLQDLYDHSKSKTEMANKLGIPTNQSGTNITNDLYLYFKHINLTLDDLHIENLKKHWLEVSIKEYNDNPKCCSYCGKPLPYERRNSKCCNQSCGSALGNKKKGARSEETKKKISETSKKRVYKKIITSNHKLISELIAAGKILNSDNYEYDDIYVNEQKLKHHICCICNKTFYGRIIKSGKIGNGNTCSDSCHNKLLSLNAKQFRKNEILNGTFKGWKTRNIISYPEKFWMKVLDNNNIPYIKEYTVKQEDNQKCYFLDFYIEINGRRIDLEIDGKQHTYKDRLMHDQKRDEYIKSLGIEVYRISWNEINTDAGSLCMKEKIDNFLGYIN